MRRMQGSHSQEANLKGRLALALGAALVLQDGPV